VDESRRVLVASLAALLVLVLAFGAITGVAVRLFRRLGIDPRVVLVWFGLAEAPRVHSGRRVHALPG
jgi:hypothetical protein